MPKKLRTQHIPNTPEEALENLKSYKKIIGSCIKHMGCASYSMITDQVILDDKDLFIILLNSTDPPPTLKAYPQYCDDREIALLSMKLWNSSLRYLSPRLRNDHGLVLEILKPTFYYDISFVGSQLLDSLDFATDLMNLPNKYYTFKFISERLQQHTGLQYLLLKLPNPSLEDEFDRELEYDLIDCMSPLGYSRDDAIVCVRLAGT